MVTVSGISRPKDVYEALDLLHTRVIDNLGEDSPLLAVLENAMENAESCDELASPHGPVKPETLELERLLDEGEPEDEPEPVDDVRRCQILVITKKEFMESPLKGVLVSKEYPGMERFFGKGVGLEIAGVDMKKVTSFLEARYFTPPDSKVVKWYEDNEKDQFILLLHSMTFSSIPEGEKFPIFGTKATKPIKPVETFGFDKVVKGATIPTREAIFEI